MLLGSGRCLPPTSVVSVPRDGASKIIEWFPHFLLNLFWLQRERHKVNISHWRRQRTGSLSLLVFALPISVKSFAFKPLTEILLCLSDLIFKACILIRHFFWLKLVLDLDSSAWIRGLPSLGSHIFVDHLREHLAEVVTALRYPCSITAALPPAATAARKVLCEWRGSLLRVK